MPQPRQQPDLIGAWERGNALRERRMDRQRANDQANQNAAAQLQTNRAFAEAAETGQPDYHFLTPELQAKAIELFKDKKRGMLAVGAAAQMADFTNGFLEMAEQGASEQDLVKYYKGMYPALDPVNQKMLDPDQVDPDAIAYNLARSSEFVDFASKFFAAKQKGKEKTAKNDLEAQEVRSRIDENKAQAAKYTADAAVNAMPRASGAGGGRAFDPNKDLKDSEKLKLNALNNRIRVAQENKMFDPNADAVIADLQTQADEIYRAAQRRSEGRPAPSGRDLTQYMGIPKAP